jgi:chromosome segregation ATPase
MDNIRREEFDTLSKQIGEIHINSVIMKEAVNGIKDQVTKQNGRIGKLEHSHEESIQKHALYEERLSNHMKQDEREYDSIRTNLSSLNDKTDRIGRKVDGIVVRTGALIAAAGILGYVLKILADNFL